MSNAAQPLIVSRRWLTRALEDLAGHVSETGGPRDFTWLRWLQGTAHQLRSIDPGVEINLAIMDAPTWRREIGD